MSYRLVFIARTSIFLAIILLMEPLLPRFVELTGINLILFLAVITTGYPSGAVIGLMGPWISQKQGIIPLEMTPIVPYIIIGNLLLVCVFYHFYHNRQASIIWTGSAVILASIVKFLMIHVPVVLFMELPPALQTQLNQLYSALLGGLLALLVTKILKNYGIKDFQQINPKGTPL